MQIKEVITIMINIVKWLVLGLLGLTALFVILGLNIFLVNMFLIHSPGIIVLAVVLAICITLGWFMDNHLVL